ncbi:MAG: hypothetical protein Q9172_005814 [Xanthocarpia lactea]
MPGLSHRESCRSLSSCFSSVTHDNPIEIPIPSSDFPKNFHQPRWPEPPSTATDSKGLRDRKAFADRVPTNYRKISPRLLRFILVFGEKCNRYRKGKSKNREEDLATIEINDAMLRSRWDAEEGTEGLWQGILDVMNAFIEHRMAVDYGDYLAVTLDGYRTPSMSWKGVKWSKVAEMMEEEEEEMRIWRKKLVRPSQKPETPILDDIRKAAAKKKMLPAHVAFEIREYGKRNAQCHSGVRDLINNAAWHELAELILRDKQTLGNVYKNDPHGRNGMLQCITNLQRQWFDTVYFDGNGFLATSHQKKRMNARKAWNTPSAG